MQHINIDISIEIQESASVDIEILMHDSFPDASILLEV